MRGEDFRALGELGDGRPADPGAHALAVKRALARMNAWFGEAGLEQHPDKTFIGRIERGFDWLGYQFDGKGRCSVAARAVE